MFGIFKKQPTPAPAPEPRPFRLTVYITDNRWYEISLETFEEALLTALKTELGTSTLVPASNMVVRFQPRHVIGWKIEPTASGEEFEATLSKLYAESPVLLQAYLKSLPLKP